MRGAWIEIVVRQCVRLALLSLPVRGAWIEIASSPRQAGSSVSLPVRGAWIEIPGAAARIKAGDRRSPCGERGLKWQIDNAFRRPQWSLPVRGAWIEIGTVDVGLNRVPSLPVRGAWIEI